MAKRAMRLSGRRGEGAYTAHVLALPVPATIAFSTPAEAAASLERNLQRAQALQAAHQKAGSAAFVARVRTLVAAGSKGSAVPQQQPLPLPLPPARLPLPPVALRRSAVQENLPDSFAPLLPPAPTFPTGPLVVVPLSPSKAVRRLRGPENDGAPLPQPPLSQSQPPPLPPPQPLAVLQQHKQPAAPPPKGVVARLRSLMGW
jgi:hypothetical protein